MVKAKNFLLSFLLLGSVLVQGQKTLIYSHQDADYKAALDLLAKEKYTAAQRKFKKVYSRIQEPHSEVKMNSEYYVALCALELFNKDAEYLFVKFIDHHPQSPKVRKARFQLGRYNYRKKRWTSTIKWFEQVDENDLEAEEVPEFNFKYGYALFKKKQYVEAQKLFHKAKDSDGDYAVPASFYFAHLNYKFGHYETAFKGFKALEDDPAFGPIVPYYITQIYYLQKKNEDLVTYGSLFLDSANTKRAPEIARLVGEGYYNLGDFGNSIKYFEKFMEKTSEVDTLAYYQLGYSYYKGGDFGKALQNFQKAADNETEVGQLALYYIGDCYIKVGNKKAARSAFKYASKNDHSLEVTENALFNYAKLSFELDIDPYHESIVALEKFIARYPNSANVNKARKLLLNVYLNTKNYQRAISALEKIKDKGPDLQYAYQKIAYYRGVQVFNSGGIGMGARNTANFLKAIYFFDKSLKYPEDRQIVALAHYWKAESFYRMGKYKAAINEYEAFKKAPGSILLDEYKEVDYQLGYSYLRLNDYGPAIKAYRVFADKMKGEKSIKLTDALLRTGDSYLILSNNLQGSARKNELIHAVNFYKKAIATNLRETDYAYYQLGQAYGLLNKYELEAESLENLIFKFKDSKYIDNAKYKAGVVYYDHLEKYDIAFKYFQDLVSNHNNDTRLVQKSLNKMGNINRNIYKKPEEALKNFGESALLDPRTPEGKGGLVGYEQTCKFDLKDANRYFTFRDKTGLPPVSEGKKDSSVFEAAKEFFIESNYEKSAVSLNGYLGQFPNGIFKNTANYMLAESYFKQSKYAEALPFFEKVNEAPYGEYSEEALYKSAMIHMENKDYQKAIGRYLTLEERSEYDVYIKDARVGLMTAYNELEDHENTAKYAVLVEGDKLVDNTSKYQATLLLGNALLKAYKFDEATKAYERVVEGTQKIMAAEAQYNIAYIHYVKERYDESQLAITKLIKELAVFQDWASKGLILLSDIYVKREDLFQAKYILKSVVENHEGEEIVAIAEQKLKEIDEIEKAAIIKKEKESVDINIGGETEADETIFDIEEEDDEPLDSLNFNEINVAPVDSTENK